MFSLEQGRDQGCDVAVVLAQGVGSQKTFEKVGFEEIVDIPYKDIKDEQGNQLINTKNGTTSSKFYVMKL